MVTFSFLPIRGLFCMTCTRALSEPILVRVETGHSAMHRAWVYISLPPLIYKSTVGKSEFLLLALARFLQSSAPYPTAIIYIDSMRRR